MRESISIWESDSREVFADISLRLKNTIPGKCDTIESYIVTMKSCACSLTAFNDFSKQDI